MVERLRIRVKNQDLVLLFDNWSDMYVLNYAVQIFQFIAVRKIPWAKANLNYTAQALIVSAGMLLSIYIWIFFF